jgi:hypothetical protein
MARLVGRLPFLAWGFAITVALLLLAGFMAAAWGMGSLTPDLRAPLIGASVILWFGAMRGILRRV